MKPVLCIAGPTASGKSAWAVNIAKKINGEIINADSMQVYNDLQILTARPTLADMEGVPHHLFGHINGRDGYSVGHWTREAVPIILDCLARDKIPILTGGTGLYFKALLKGLADIPDPGEDAFKSASALLEQGICRLRQEAEHLDPVSTARILGNDPQRLLRVVSVAKGTGRPLSEWQKNTRPIIPRGFWQGAVLMPERAELYERINMRYDSMVRNGGLAEAKNIQEGRLKPGLPVTKALGVQPLIDHLGGKISLEIAIEQAKRDTRRFAKRQCTWFNGQSEGWFRVTFDAQKVDFEEKIFPLCR